MNDGCLLSIVVPTHNRAGYALPCIASALAIESDDFEVIVADTSTDDELETGIGGTAELRDDDRLKYARLRQPSNLTKNHNDAVELARGEFICIIGDDDFITSAILSVARKADALSLDVVAQKINSNYAWPDFQSLNFKFGHAARLYVPRRLDKPLLRSAPEDLDAALGRALQGTERLPRCYHGLVRRRLMREVKRRTGEYFSGSSPDMSGAVSLATLTGNYWELAYPFVVPGASGGSNSGRSAMDKHKGKLESEVQTRAFAETGWVSGVPRLFSVETVWAHAGLSSLQAMAPDLVQRFNYEQLLALCLVRHPEFEEAIAVAIEEVAILRNASLASVRAAVKDRIRKLRVARLTYLARRALVPTAAGGRKFLGEICDVAAARPKLEDYLATTFGPVSNYLSAIAA